MSEKKSGDKKYTDFFNPHFPSDLILIGVWLAVSLLTIYLPYLNTTPVRFVFALPIMLFIPGYCFIAALFPKEGDINLMERMVLSIGFSIVVVPLIGLGLSFTQWGIRLDPFVVSISVFTVVMILITLYQRSQLPFEDRFRMPFSEIAGTIREEIFPADATRVGRLLGAILILGIFLALAITIYVITVPLEGEKFTEFYILGENRTVANYPTLNIAGQNYPMFVGIGNHENRETRYTVETWMVRTTYDNVTNTSRIVAMDPNARLTLTLASNETTIIPYNLSFNKTGYNRVEFLLFEEDVPGFDIAGRDRINVSYRNLHLVLPGHEEE